MTGTRSGARDCMLCLPTGPARGQEKPIKSRATARTQRIVSDPIGPVMVRLTIPSILGIVSMMLMGLVDTFFISKLGTAQLAAVSFSIPVYMTLISISLGLGMALGSLNSRLIGESRHDDSARFVTDSMMLAGAISVAVSAVMYLSIDPLFKLMGASEEVMPFIRDYMSILLVGMPLLMLAIIGNNTFRSIGNVKASAYFSSMLALSNMALDPLLIFGLGPFPEMGMRGAALATVIASAMTVVCSAYVLRHREHLLDFAVPRLTHLLPNWRDLMSIGVPAIGANFMTPFAAAVMTAMIASHGAEAVAGFGVGSRIESVSLLVIFAISSTLPMFIGQNLGAGKGHRGYLALMMCLRFVVLLQAGIYAVLFLASPFIAAVFSDDPAVREVIRTFLLILPVTYGAHGVVILVMVSLNVMRHPRMALLITIIRLLILYLPLAFLGSKIWGIPGLFLGAALGNIIAGLVAFQIARQICDNLGLSAPAPAAAPQET